MYQAVSMKPQCYKNGSIVPCSAEFSKASVTGGMAEGGDLLLDEVWLALVRSNVGFVQWLCSICSHLHKPR